MIYKKKGNGKDIKSENAIVWLQICTVLYKLSIHTNEAFSKFFFTFEDVMLENPQNLDIFSIVKRTKVKKFFVSYRTLS